MTMEREEVLEEAASICRLYAVRKDKEAYRLDDKEKFQSGDDARSRARGARECANAISERAMALRVPTLPTVNAQGDNSGWIAIETAPKDCSLFLAWNGKVCFAKWSVKFGLWDIPYMRLPALKYNQPTHWMPLPQPPTAQPQQKEGE